MSFLLYIITYTNMLIIRQQCGNCECITHCPINICLINLKQNLYKVYVWGAGQEQVKIDQQQANYMYIVYFHHTSDTHIHLNKHRHTHTHIIYICTCMTTDDIFTVYKWRDGQVLPVTSLLVLLYNIYTLSEIWTHIPHTQTHTHTHACVHTHIHAYTHTIN